MTIVEKILYPDGSFYPKIKQTGDLSFTHKVNSYEDLWFLGQILETLNHVYPEETPTVLIPNLLDAQADRRFDPLSSHNLKLVCNFLNQFKANYKIFHPHNAEVVEALLDNVEIIDNSKFIKQVLWDIDKNVIGRCYISSDNLILMSSDAGGFKPLIKLCDKINWCSEVYSASKSRGFLGGVNKLTQFIDRRDFEGKDILIIDDICVYGGTFKGLATMLKERNCGKLYLAVSHLTIEHHPQDSVFEYFDKVFCTNSKYDEYTAENENREMLIPKNLQVIKL